MTAIPNTCRRGAIYWYRRSRRLPCGNRCRPIVSLRTACPRAARRRAAILTAKFEELYVRLFGNSARRFAIDAEAAKRIFQKEFNRALDALEQEREQAELSSYEYGSIDVFPDVHEAVYGHLAKTNGTGASLTFAEWAGQVGPDHDIASVAQEGLSSMNAIWHQSLEDTAEALESEGIETDVFYMGHTTRLRFEARVAAVQEYRRRLADPKLRFEASWPAFICAGHAGCSCRGPSCIGRSRRSGGAGDRSHLVQPYR